MSRPSGWLRDQLQEITRSGGLSEITNSGDPKLSRTGRKHFVTVCLLIFFLALGVRLLTWQDLRLQVWKVQTYVTSDYKYSAYLLARQDFKGFLYDINRMGHPPGYPIVLAGIFRTIGDSDDAVQLVQVFCDSIAAVVVFLIVFELLPFGVAAFAGLLAALSPQFAYHSVLLLPDSLAGLPIVLAVYLVVRALRRPRLLTFVMAGALVGLSCWLRANALLLAPFLAVVLLILFERGRRLRFSAALLTGAFLVIAPITIKNYIVFHRFVPLSLGAGQTLLEGIADYDQEGRFNIPITDLGIMRQEAEWYHQPDYALWLFGSDGIQRERMRTARGFAVIRSHPLWFAGVMGRRGVASFKLDRVPLVSPESPVSHSLTTADKLEPVWTRSTAEIMADGSVAATGAKVELVDEGRMLRIVGDRTRYGNQLVSSPIAVERDRDYVVRLPLKLEEGRALVKVTNMDQSQVLAATVLDLIEGVAPSEQALQRVELPFVSDGHSQVRLVFANNASTPGPPVARIGQAEVFELGPSAYHWTRYPRFVVRNLQRLFLTAWMLPLMILGVLILLWARRGRTVLLLLTVPLYYLIFQSALHTERRYVIVIHYFLTMFAAVFLWLVFRLVKEAMVGLLTRARQTGAV